MLKNIFFLLFICLFHPLQIAAQSGFPKNEFASPLSIPLFLAGNFAELRSNHFHTGIDIKTNGQEGLDILSAADGVVSRIRVSPYGYGKALYIDHPNGYTTVYAHLQGFSPKIDELVRKLQFEKQSFSVDEKVLDHNISVKKGEVVAISGNTGGSSGPHLHFEIRNTKTERALNPLLFGFDIQDNIPPEIRGLRLYPMEQGSAVDGSNEPKSYVISGGNGKYKLKYNERIRVFGKIGVALHTIDKLNGFPNKCGIYELSLSMNDAKVFSQRLDSIDFNESRYINAYKDYELYHKNNWHYHKSFLEQNNELFVYSPGNNFPNGIIDFTDGKDHLLKYDVTDAYGNLSQLEFKVHADTTAQLIPPEINLQGIEFLEYDRDNIVRKPGITILFPKGSLYKDMVLHLDSIPACVGCLSPVYQVQDPFVPLHRDIELRVKLNQQVKAPEDKLVAVRFTGSGNNVRSVGGTVENGIMTVKTNLLGKFSVMADTLPPLLKPLQSTVNARGKFSFQVRDDLSGIASYNAWIDEEWVLLEYEPKNSRMWIDFSRISLQPGKHSLLVEITDNVGNLSRYTLSF